MKMLTVKKCEECRYYDKPKSYRVSIDFCLMAMKAR